MVIILPHRLDRISRNIGDFAKLIEDLGDREIDFISIREQFDTSSSMWRAMMYIASVFSQLERETIAERIRDNMHKLSKAGRWLGRTTPTGYESEAVTNVTIDGKLRKRVSRKRFRKKFAWWNWSTINFLRLAPSPKPTDRWIASAWPGIEKAIEGFGSYYCQARIEIGCEENRVGRWKKSVRRV